MQAKLGTTDVDRSDKQRMTEYYSSVNSANPRVARQTKIIRTLLQGCIDLNNGSNYTSLIFGFKKL